MLERLKFWKKEDNFSLGETPDPFSGQTDPLADHQDPYTTTGPSTNTDPLQMTPPNMGEGSSFNPHIQSPEPGYSSPLTRDAVPETLHQDYPEGRNRDMELILAKLDSIKAELDSLHQRVKKIEQATEAKRSAW